MLQEYLVSFRTRNYSPKTVSIYTYALKRFVDFLGREGLSRMQDVGRDDLRCYRLYLQEREYENTSIEVFLRAVKQFLGYLEKEQHIFLNPADGLVLHRSQRKLMPVPSEEDIEKLLQHPNTATSVGMRDRALLETAYGTGARLGELHSMTVARLHLSDGTTRLHGKGNRERVVPLGRMAVEWLEGYMTEARPKLLGSRVCDELWIGQGGEPLGYMGVRCVVLAHARGAGIAPPIGPHALRRACATHMLRNGADPIQIQHLLGHASLKTLSHYLRVTIADLQSAHQKTRPAQ